MSREGPPRLRPPSRRGCGAGCSNECLAGIGARRRRLTTELAQIAAQVAASDLAIVTEDAVWFDPFATTTPADRTTVIAEDERANLVLAEDRESVIPYDERTTTVV